jgi:hypothetical protein
MPARFRTFAVVLVAAAALATTWARAAAVQPAAHVFVKGEHFRYSDVLALGLGEGVVVIDGPQTLTSVDDIDVVDVSASAVTLADRVQHDKATGFAPSTSIVRASADGTWRYADGRIAENIATWDPVRFGPQPPALTAGQQWQVDVPRRDLDEPGHAVVRVVSVDPDNLVLRVEGTLSPSLRGPIRITKTWSTDVTFAHGIVRELHRVDVQHYDRGAGLPAVEDRTDRRVRLLTHTTP